MTTHNRPKVRKYFVPSLKMYVWVGIGLLLLAITVGVGRHVYLQHHERRQFIKLGQHFKTLQKSFNALDEGWDYQELCAANPNAFAANSCGIILVNTDMQDPETKITNYVQVIQHTLPDVGMVTKSAFEDNVYTFRLRSFSPTMQCEIRVTAFPGMAVWCEDTTYGAYFKTSPNSSMYPNGAFPAPQ